MNAQSPSPTLNYQSNGFGFMSGDFVSLKAELISTVQ